MTTVVRPYPTRAPVGFKGKDGQIVLDQLRAIDRQRLVGKLGMVTVSTAQAASAILVEMFSRA